MNTKDLLDAIGEAKDEYVEDARNRQKNRLPKWAGRSAAVAACLVAVIGLGAYVIGEIGGRAGGGGNTGMTYMYYTGPVLPLTVQGDAESLTAERSINFDFSPYYTVQEPYESSTGEIMTHDRYYSESIITDRYVLTNESEEDVTVTGVYPFAGSFSEKEYYPSVAVNGAEVQTSINPGPYSGGYTGVWGGSEQEMEEGSVNLAPLDSFAGYEALLTGGGYMSCAFDGFPELDQPVTVYRMSDYVYTEDTSATNPTLNMEFYIDYEQTVVLTYGMNGGSHDYESGYCSRNVSGIEVRSNVSPEYRVPEDAYMVLLGEDIDSYVIQGYRDGGCDEGEEVDDLGCTITRYETTLGEFLWYIISEKWEQSSEEDTRMLYDLTAELMTTSGPLGELVQRYDFGMIESMIVEASNNSRVIYLSFELVIPAGGSAVVEATAKKDASLDFIGDDIDRNGYDMATQLDSELTFTRQTATISGYEEIEILRQNFGFDIANGITEVTLDMTRPHYWLEVRKAD